MLPTPSAAEIGPPPGGDEKLLTLDRLAAGQLDGDATASRFAPRHLGTGHDADAVGAEEPRRATGPLPAPLAGSSCGAASSTVTAPRNGQKTWPSSTPIGPAAEDDQRRRDLGRLDGLPVRPVASTSASPGHRGAKG